MSAHPLGIDHVGIVVPRLDDAVARFTALYGAQVELREVLADRGIEAAMLVTGTGRLELIQPLDADGTTARFLARRGEGIHHLALVVPNVAAAIAELSAAGGEMIDTKPRPGLGGHMVAFVRPASSCGVLMELVQTADAA